MSESPVPEGKIVQAKIAKVVQLPIQRQYVMPQMCCECEATTNIVTQGKYLQRMSGKHSFSIWFPLCRKCTDASKVINMEGMVGCSLAVVLGITMLIVFFLLEGKNNSGIENDVKKVIWYGLFLGGPLVIWGIMLLMRRVNRKRVGISTYNLGKQVSKAVKISKYSPKGFFSDGRIAFEFTSPKFADHFARLNVKTE